MPPPSKAGSPAKGARVENPNPVASLLKRWKAAAAHGFKKIADAVSKTTDPIPKVGSRETCLSWVFNGFCKEDCKRCAAHVPITDSMADNLHTYLDKCGVPKLE